MPFTDLSRSRGIQFRPFSKIAFFIFVANFLILMQLGAKHVESPFIEFGQVSTVIFFSYFLVVVPFLSLFENSLLELSSCKFNLLALYPEKRDNNKNTQYFYLNLFYCKVRSILRNKAFLYTFSFIAFSFFICILFIILNYYGYLEYSNGLGVDYCLSETEDEGDVVWPYKQKYSEYTLDQLRQVRDNIIREHTYVTKKLNFFRDRYIRARDFEHIYRSLPARGFYPPNIESFIQEFMEKRIACERQLKPLHLQEEKLLHKTYAVIDRLEEIYKKNPELRPAAPVRTPKRPWEVA